MTLRLYDKEKPLSESPHATVLRGEFKTELVAVKRLRYGEPEIFEREFRQLIKLEHKNLITFKAFLRNRDGTVDVVMHLAELETLRDALVNYKHTVDWRFSIIHQISSGLAYLHDNRVVHGNLRPDNILFQNLAHGRALIGNYSASVRRQSPPKSTDELLFEAPEETLSAAGDVYALTLIICCVLFHDYPRSQKDRDVIMKAALMERGIPGNESFLRLLRLGIATDPEKRPQSHVFKDMFNFGIPEQTYRVAKRGRSIDECFKVFVMILTCAIILLLSCDAETLNFHLMKYIPDPPEKYD